MNKGLKLIYFFLISALISGCGLKFNDLVKKEPNEQRQFNITNATFTSYVTNFETVAKNEFSDPNFSVGDIPVNFGDTENPEYQGVCFVYADGKKEIIIDKTWWDKANELNRQALLFHELGHCRLNRDHNNEVLETDGKTIKVSLMNAVVPSAPDYHKYQEEYHHELYTYDKEQILMALGIE